MSMKSIKKSFLVAYSVLFLLLLTAASTVLQSGSRVRVALQPLGKVDNALLQVVKTGIHKEFGDINIAIFPAIDLPKSAYYKPRKRYRAEKLLYYLRSYYQINKPGKFNRVLGVTTRDISATKGKYYDWGIFGYAFLGGGPAVISNYRLKRNARSQAHVVERVIKTAVHELGHTFGLVHCPVYGCIMQDAKGTIKTVDQESGRFCRRCRNLLYSILKRWGTRVPDS